MDLFFYIMLIPVTIFIISILVKMIYYKYSKLGQAQYNKMKHEQEEFIDKWGKK